MNDLASSLIIQITLCCCCLFNKNYSYQIKTAKMFPFITEVKVRVEFSCSIA